MGRSAWLDHNHVDYSANHNHVDYSANHDQFDQHQHYEHYGGTDHNLDHVAANYIDQHHRPAYDDHNRSSGKLRDKWSWAGTRTVYDYRNGGY